MGEREGEGWREKKRERERTEREGERTERDRYREHRERENIEITEVGGGERERTERALQKLPVIAQVSSLSAHSLSGMFVGKEWERRANSRWNKIMPALLL